MRYCAFDGGVGGQGRTVEAAVRDSSVDQWCQDLI